MEEFLRVFPSKLKREDHAVTWLAVTAPPRIALVFFGLLPRWDHVVVGTTPASNSTPCDALDASIAVLEDQVLPALRERVKPK